MPAKSPRSGSKPRWKPASTSSRPPKKKKQDKPKKKASTDPFKSKQVSSFYFKCVLDEDEEPTAVYVCRCGVQRQMEPNTGYTNLLGHIFMWHTNFVAERTSASANTGTLIGFTDDKTHKVLSWIDMVLSCNLPFSFCETQAASDYVNIGSLSTDSLVKYMCLLVREVETVIASILPKSFGIIFDGWSFRSEHYVAVFASFRHNDKAENILIAMPMHARTFASLDPS